MGLRLRLLAPLLAPLLAFAASASASARGGMTPVEKVIELLVRLQAKLEQEGKDEAAAYDKYACFCKEQSDGKLYAIEKSTARIEKLTAQIDSLSAEIASLDKEIADLATKIAGLETDMANAKATRESEHAAFLVSQADAKGAIDAVERAIAALKESKAALAGKSELEGAALAQVRSFTTLALAAAATARLGEHEVEELSNLAEAVQPGKAYEYKYHSNDIIATLENLRLKFKQTLNDVEQAEFDTNAAFETKQLAWADEKLFAEKEKTEKAALAEAKREEKATAEAEKTEETNDKNSDNNYLQVLVADCEAKGALWDQRSKTRADELKAIADATEALKNGVAPNWQANKKLAEVQVPPSRAAVPAAAAAARAAAAPSFLQLHSRLRGAGRRGAAAAEHSLLLAEKARAVLIAAAEELKSPLLSAAALKVRVSEDHFVKVRQLIKDLVARLEADADSEKTQKTFCDAQMKDAITKRDTEQSKIEDFTAQITGKEARKAQLLEDIALLSEQIAANKKALKEATELRLQEQAENNQTIADATLGKEAVEQAIQVLNEFYQGQSLLQRGSSAYVPPNSDREGHTLADLAPPIFDTNYRGAQEASKGIVGILEVILSDFERTISATKDAEDSAALDFANFKQTIEDDTKTKETSVADKQAEITTIEDDLVALKDKLVTAENDKATAESALKDLESMCVAGEETYEQRVAKRNQEIAALKEAHAILESWQG